MVRAMAKVHGVAAHCMDVSMCYRRGNAELNFLMAMNRYDREFRSADAFRNKRIRCLFDTCMHGVPVELVDLILEFENWFNLGQHSLFG